MDAKEEREIGINVVILGKRPQFTIFQIDVPTCDSVQRNSSLAIYMCWGPFLLNQKCSKLSPGVLEELFGTFPLVLPYPTQLIAFPVVQDSLINSH